MSSFPNDANIPLLTEIIPLDADEQAAESSAPVTPVPSPAYPTAAPAPSSASDAVTMPVASSVNAAAASEVPTLDQAPAAILPEQESLLWDQLVRETGDRVLKKLHARIDQVLEQQVRDQLADVLQLAVADMTNHIQVGLRDTLHKLIVHAVEEEASRLRKPDL